MHKKVSYFSCHGGGTIKVQHTTPFSYDESLYTVEIDGAEITLDAHTAEQVAKHLLTHRRFWIKGSLTRGELT